MVNVLVREVVHINEISVYPDLTAYRVCDGVLAVCVCDGSIDRNKKVCDKGRTVDVKAFGSNADFL